MRPGRAGKVLVGTTFLAVSWASREKLACRPLRDATIKGSVPAFVDHMELVTLTKRTGFLELIPTCKSHESFLSSSNFEYPSAKFAPTGCRSYPNHILRNYAHTKIAITDKFTQSSFGKPVHHHVLRLRTRLRRIRDCLPTPVCKSVHHSHYTYRKNR